MRASTRGRQAVIKVWERKLTCLGNHLVALCGVNDTKECGILEAERSLEPCWKQHFFIGITLAYDANQKAKTVSASSAKVSNASGFG